WVVQQRHNAVADQVDGGVITGGDEQEGGGQQLCFGESVTTTGRFYQRADEVIARLATFVGEELGQHGCQFGECSLQLRAAGLIEVRIQCGLESIPNAD